VMGIYLSHSLREYVGGRHTYRMGIARMIGVDSTLGDPNSFGASIVYALPFAVAVWRGIPLSRLGRYLVLSYFALSVLCILLTGSRGSLVGLMAWGTVYLFRVRRGWVWLMVACCVAPVGFFALPESLQNRFETIIDSDAGPASAKASGDGRLLGFLNGFELLARSPISGVGPGAWRPATGSSVESHNLYGQVTGETGLAGMLGLMLIVLGYLINGRFFRKDRAADPRQHGTFLHEVAIAAGTGLFLLLFIGNFGHNLFRFTWLWYGGFLIIARHCREQQWLVEEPIVEEDLEEDYEEDAIPEGWTWHPAERS
ncbi:MAG: O-antigen ligase family protein, partial [Gemmataceae bacterium]